MAVSQEIERAAAARDRAPAWHRLAGLLQRAWRQVIILPPYAWLFLFFLMPFVIVFKISFAEAIIAIPPVTDLLEWGEGLLPSIHVTFDNFLFLMEDRLYWFSYLNSLKLALVSTVLCLLVGFPMAYGIALAKPAVRNMLLLLVILPFWTCLLYTSPSPRDS